MLPDKHADEPVAVVEADLWKLYGEALTASSQWKRIADAYLKKIQDAMAEANAYALVVDGVKVATYRPQRNYAVKELQKAYPEMTKHYTRQVTTEQFDIDLFAAAHPDLAEPYRVRAFKKVGEQ